MAIVPSSLLSSKPHSFPISNTVLSPLSKSTPLMSASSQTTARVLTVSTQEWQRWGPISPLPSKVNDIIKNLEHLPLEDDSPMRFGGMGGKLKGDLKAREEKKHRATYEALDDSEEKIQFFSARQIACRVVGSRGYLCQKCWLPQDEDCMCSMIRQIPLSPKIRLWLYMHPKDFLRQNNTGKLLWQVFGVHSASLCIFGISEMEEIMWNSFKISGKDKVWCLYPQKNLELFSVEDAIRISLDPSRSTEHCTNENEIINFILLDGTWSNSAAMLRRLKEKSKLIWGEEHLPCISLSTGASSMHKLRPQPSWDRTCTAAAAVALLEELETSPNFSNVGLEEQGEAVRDALGVLLEALTRRRLRMGRSIARRMRRGVDI